MVASTNPSTQLQCKQVPLKSPKFKNKTLEDMYQSTDVDVKDDQHRKQDETDFTVYRAKHVAEAYALTGCGRALATAIKCEKLSLQAKSACFPFPIVTGIVLPKTELPTKLPIFEQWGACLYRKPCIIPWMLCSSFSWESTDGVLTMHSMRDKQEAKDRLAYLFTSPLPTLTMS